MFYVLQSMNNARQRGDTTQHSIYPNCYAILATLYHDLGYGEKSIAMYKTAIQKTFRNALEYEFLDNYIFVNSLVLELIKYNRIKEAVATARQIIAESPPTYDLEQGAVAEIQGNCYVALKQYDMAEKYFLQMARFYNSSDFYASLGDKVLGRFYLQRHQYEKARVLLLNQFKKIPPSAVEFSGIIEDELLYYKIDSAQKKYLPAIDHFRKYKSLNDSVFNINKSKQIEELQLKYQTGQRETKIKLLTKDGQLQRQNVIRANNARNLTYAGIVLLTLFIGLLYYNYLLKQRSNTALNQLVVEKDLLLEQKEWLLKEIHHRVKNNLQIVMGLLQRQSAYINNEEGLSAIRNSENRMHSIALIHQRLYQSDSPGFISMPEYITELVSYLKDSFDLGNHINFRKEVDHTYINVSQAVPLGLILNEAITNAIKYAFINKADGEIAILFSTTADGYHYLAIKDNGAGLPNHLDISAIDSMGMSLMKGLSKQLGGVFNLNYDGGVTISIKFKVENFTYTTPKA
jgi:two-component sensor histidine kinase